MPNPIPSTLFPNISINANNEIVFNTSNHANPTFPDLTTAEASESTGDVRKIAYAILKRIQNLYPAISPAPLYMSASSSVTDGGYPNHVRTIQVSFVLEPGGTEDVANES